MSEKKRDSTAQNNKIQQTGPEEVHMLEMNV